MSGPDIAWRLTGALGGLLAMISPLVAWVTAPEHGESLSGMEFDDGKLALSFAIIGLGVIGGRAAIDQFDRWPVLRYWLDGATIVIGLIVLAAVANLWSELNGIIEASGADISISAGPYLGLFGSLLVIASGGLSIVARVVASRKTTGETPPAAASSALPLDELEKWADLRERGIITEEEFDAKKKELLGL